MANQKGIEIINNITDRTEVFADQNMLSVILRNLITNAVKFTDTGGYVILSSNESLNATQIIVEDNGIGIKPEKIKTLFQISENKSTSGTNGETGTGLGLILCKDFIEQHSGKIWVESEIGKGSIFTFSIPKNHKN